MKRRSCQATRFQCAGLRPPCASSGCRARPGPGIPQENQPAVYHPSPGHLPANPIRDRGSCHIKSGYTGAIFSFLTALHEGLAYSGRPYTFSGIPCVGRQRPSPPCALLQRIAYSSRTVLRRVPMASTTISQTSPGVMKICGVRLLPTPPGVPVTITSPGDSGRKVEM